jgi:hypothetical protein
MNEEEHLNTLLPKEFFQLQRHAPPKASVRVLWLLTGVIYSVTAIICVLLFLAQSQQSISETQLSFTDLSDSEWKCTTASPISRSFSLSLESLYELAAPL